MDKLEETKFNIISRIQSNVGGSSTNTERYSRSLLWLNVYELVDELIEFMKGINNNR